jgi:Flp pilus assembly protein CpaB
MARAISRETMTVGIVAILAGLVAAWGLRVYLTAPDEVKQAPPPQPAKQRMFLAGTDLPADRVITSHDVIQVGVTNEEFQRRFGTIKKEQILMAMRAIVGRCLKTPVKQGQPFLITDFYLEGTGPSISKKLQPGYRAVRVQVTDVREAGVQPGMFVDVMFRANARPAKNGQPAIPEKTLTLLRHIEVLEAEKPKAKTGQSKKPMLVTLAVPEQKEDMFGVIAGRGDLWLVPTPTKEAADGAGGDIANAETLAQLLGIKPRPRPPKPFETAIYHRDRVKINRFIDGKLVSIGTINEGIRDWERGTAPVPADLPAPTEKRAPGGAATPEQQEEQ